MKNRKKNQITRKKMLRTMMKIKQLLNSKNNKMNRKMTSVVVMISLIGSVRTKGAVRTIGNGQVEDGKFIKQAEWLKSSERSPEG